MKADQVDQALRQKFLDEDERLVFWHDPKSEFAEYVARGFPAELEAVTVLDVTARRGRRETGCSTSGATARRGLGPVDLSLMHVVVEVLAVGHEPATSLACGSSPRLVALPTTRQ